MQSDCERSFRRKGPALENVLRALGPGGAWVCLDDADGRQILSFAGSRPLASGPDYLEQIRQHIQPSALVPKHPFSGGLMGFVSYELGRFSEQMPSPPTPLSGPELGLCRFEGGLCFDKGEWWVAGTPAFLAQAHSLLHLAENVAVPDYRPAVLETIPSDAVFLQAVEQVLMHIRAGDCYQVNVARRLELRAPSCWVEAYLRLRAHHPAAFGALCVQAGQTVLSNSPELFIRVSGDQVETAPIKGTRPRLDPVQAKSARQELVDSEKERAELTMIVDMARNDLSRCSVPGSVRAGPREILHLPTLFHAQQRVRGRLLAGKDAVDVFAAAFPPASVTGAPKVKAMACIANLEPVCRGVYTGAIGYFADGGDACFSVAIRTLSAHGERAYFHVGSGIVADSCPQQELDESAWKAKAMIQALTKP